MAFQVKGKTALVTGGGSGICLAFTKLLLANECSVVIADLQLTPEAVELVKEGGDEKAKVIFQKTDVTDWRQLQAAFDVAIKEFGHLEIVCPGAGIFEPVGQFFYFRMSAIWRKTVYNLC
jgi:3-hydroxybutyrate dehydrogenase